MLILISKHLTFQLLGWMDGWMDVGYNSSLAVMS
jgi:hypothetical protein